ncbi:MAG: 2-hydroxyacid dehydrogenase [Alphaproteobacteria bacterium]|nr:2-hydroxyacid dehydrogenase [Alphaproteobacteria bacterium]
MTRTNQKRVLYLCHGNADLYRMVRDALRPGFELMTLETPDEAECLTKLAEADAVICSAEHFTRERIAAAKRLRIAQHQGVGFHDTVDWPALAERGIPLAITPGGTSTGVSEHTLMLMFAVMKRLPYLDSELRQGRFHINQIRHCTYELYGKTVGIIGMGRIGTGLAERLKPFGVRAIYHEIIDIPQARRQELGITQVPLDRLLAESDIVTVHVPLTASTRRMIDAEALARMKPTAFLINAARGGIVDEQALVAALRDGRIAGAALDVFEQEPSGPDHPLYAFPNVVLTPHVAAGTRDAFGKKMAFAFQNLEAFFDGRPVEYLVDYAAETRG